MASYRLSKIKLQQTLERLPMLRLLLPIVCGIIISQYCTLPLWFSILGATLCGVASLAFRSSLYSAFLLLFAGCISVELHMLTPKPALNRNMILLIDVESEPIKRDSFSSAQCHLKAWCDSNGEWHATDCRLNLYADSTLTLSRGERLKLRSPIRPISNRYPRYSALMRSRGFIGTAGVLRKSLLERDTLHSASLATRLSKSAVARLNRLPLSEDSRAIAQAMTTGNRTLITQELRQEYALSGASHLLAVSGLHVGVLFTLLNILLFSLPLLNRGHLIRSIIIILAIWLYALMTGLSPSVVRAAAMFSVLQISLIFTEDYRGLNSLFGVGCVMLLLNPNLIGDMSFQLSFTAVVAILSLAIPLTKRVKGSILRWLLGSVIISLCATLATAPLTSFHFGIISLGGIIINPIVIFTAQFIVGVSLVWITMPIGWLEPIFSWLIESLSTLQNGIIRYTSEVEWCAFDFRASAPLLILIYTIFIAIIIVAWSVEQKKSIPLQL